MAKQYWLLKSEPNTFSLSDLAKSPKKTTCWEGVRNYQARNLMREMKKGDDVLFYHSNADPPAAVGTASIAREAYADTYQFDPKSKYFDAKADPENPRWEMVDVRYGKPFTRALGLPELREQKALAGMELLRKGSRLSVQRVTAKQWRAILKLGGL
ncbi:MAG: EVE domain-containing protein [Deltaproteobacteria bacterium]|nr:EVE domain-containing protein [Deltaproteobacteria bacterium]